MFVNSIFEGIYASGTNNVKWQIVPCYHCPLREETVSYVESAVIQIKLVYVSSRRFSGVSFE